MRGFSLVEMLVGVAVIAMGLLGLVAALAYGVRASRSSELSSLAVGHAVHLIELIRSRNLDFGGYSVPPNSSSGINDPTGTRRALNAYPFSTDFEPSSFERHIEMTRVGTSGDYLYDVMSIKVTVYWDEGGQERSVEFEALHKKP